MRTESWSPAGRSAIRSRIASGRASWRRRLWPLPALMPRSAQTTAIRSVVGQSGAGLPAVAELLLLVAQRERLARVLLGLDAADLVLAGLVVEQQDDQAARPGARPSNPGVPASSWLARAASRRRWPAHSTTRGSSGRGR